MWRCVDVLLCRCDVDVPPIEKQDHVPSLTQERGKTDFRGAAVWVPRPGYAGWNSFPLVLLDSLSRNPASIMWGSSGHTRNLQVGVWEGSPPRGPSQWQASAIRCTGKETTPHQAKGSPSQCLTATTRAQLKWPQFTPRNVGDNNKWPLLSAQCQGELITWQWIAGIHWGWLILQALKQALPWPWLGFLIWKM